MPMAGKWRGFCPACGQSVSLREGEQWLLPAGCLLNVSHVTCQWQRDVAEVCDPGHLDVLFCQLQPHSVKTKGFVLFVMELSTLSPERTFGPCWSPGPFLQVTFCFCLSPSTQAAHPNAHPIKPRFASQIHTHVSVLLLRLGQPK